MIPPITVDLSQVIEEFSLKEQQADLLGVQVVNAVTDRIYYNWTSAVKQGLHSTRKLYLQNLQIGQNGPLSKYIILTGDFPNQLEQGFGAFDMKNGFKKGSKVKMKKNGSGWYMTIPFRFATPGALGESEIFSAVMPPDVYASVKKLQSAKTQIDTGKTKSGTGLSKQSIPTQYQTPKVRNAFSSLESLNTFSQYQHKTSIYEGISKQEKTYDGSTQSGYVSFRRVSDKSDPMSWIHPGLAAKNFAKTALSNTDVGGTADRAIDAYLSNLGF